MAKLIPSGVINLPDFAELQYKLNEQERQKQLQFDEWSSQFQKKAGTYLDADREAVQQSYDQVEKALTDLATDPDNVELRRKVREANAAYNQVAGTAQFLADNYRQQWSAYNSNPDQFSLGGENAVDVFNRERTTKRDANQIMSMASNPFTLQPKYKYDMQSPTQIADEALNNFRKNINDYIRKDGSIDEAKAREYITNYMSARYVDPAQVKNAVIYEGVREGIVGRNGELTSRADLDIIDTEEFAPNRERLAQKYSKDAIEAFMAAAPKMGINQFEVDMQRQKLALERAKLNAKQKESKYFGIEPVPYVLKTGSKNIADGFMVPIDWAPVPSKGGKIVKFGKLSGKPYVVEMQKVKELINGEQVDVFREKARLADQSDISILSKVTDGVSDSYFKGLPESQPRFKSKAQSVSSGQLDIKGAEAALIGTQEQPSGDGVWSQEMFGEDLFSPTTKGQTRYGEEITYQRYPSFPER
jgi:hypothetical protein